MPSILQGGVLNTPGGIPGNTRLALTEEGTVRSDGRQHILNIFARAWDCLTRSPEKIEANKELARAFVAELREKYGDEVANMASRELKSHLNLGRPLTAYRVSQVLEHAVQLKERIATKQNDDWLRDQGVSVREMRSQFSNQELTLLRETGLDIQIGLQYKERQIPIHPRTLVDPQNNFDLNPNVRSEELHGGAASKPYKVEHDTLGGAKSVVFKEANPQEGYSAAAGALGIDRNDARMSVRNIATKSVDELLGFNLVPDTRMGILNGKLGMVMDFVGGVPAMKKVERDVTEEMREQVALWRQQVEQGFMDENDINDMLTVAELRIDGDRILKSEDVGVQQNYNDPGLRRELVKLQLLDALTAQGDRHGGNYLIRVDDDGRFIGLGAIDNDQAFGTTITDPNDLLGQNYDRSGNDAFKGVRLPPVVDQEIKDVFDGLTDEQLRGALTGLLPEAEIEAAITRLHAIKDYLAGGPPPIVLEGNGSEQWGTQEVGEALSDRTSSYVGRDLYVLENIGNTHSYSGTVEITKGGNNEL